MKINAYLNFNGNCKEAMEFYAKVLGGEVKMMLSHEGTPAEEHVTPEWRDKILHARIEVGDQMLMASDAPPQYFDGVKGFSVSIIVEDVAEGKRIFDALSEGGTIKMPFEKTFWAEGFGMLVDRFGTPWLINAGM